MTENLIIVTNFVLNVYCLLDATSVIAQYWFVSQKKSRGLVRNVAF